MAHRTGRDRFFVSEFYMAGTLVSAVAALILFAPALAGAVVPMAASSGQTEVKSPLEKAAAFAKLGDEFRRGGNMVAALQNYRRAAEMGDARGKLRLGEFMALGQGTMRDVVGGLALVEEVAATGNTTALLLLGDLYAQDVAGREARSKAIAAYEKAASLGRSLALTRLGEAYREGLVVPADPHKSVKYYLDAMAAGRNDALVPLGRSLVDKTFAFYGSPRQGVEILAKAVGLGVPGAAAALSDCYMKGNGTAKDPAKALYILRQALDNGDVQAGRRLISIYRDGRGKAIGRNIIEARSYFARIQENLDPSTLGVEKMLLDAASAKGSAGYQAIQHELQALEGTDRPGAVRKLRSANPNAYVFVVQSRLGELGLFKSEATGQLSAPTVRAMYNYCVGHQSRDVCRQGVMTSPVTDILAAAF